MTKVSPEWLESISEQQFITRSSSIRETLKLLDETAKGILLMVNSDGVLMRTVTDGDLRRLLLSGLSLDNTLESLPEKKAVSASSSVTTRDLVNILNQYGINQIPILDSEGKPLGIAYRSVVDNSILLSTPHLGEFEQAYVSQAFNTNWIAPVGPNIDAFEQELAIKVGIKHAVAVSSGTAALHLALSVLNVSASDSVFCSSFTFVASANPILYLGAEPVFIDSENETWNMSPKALQRAFEDAERERKLPKAVIVVNLYGQSADYNKICKLCDHYGVPIVEDAAQSLGATFNNQASGTLGKIGIYSFNGNKIITTSGGGMLVTDEEELAVKAKFLSTQAREPVAWYEHKELGYNYRMSNILAGIGRGQLKVLDDRVNARRNIFDRYVELLADVPKFIWMPEANYGRSTRWLTTAIVKMNGINIPDIVSKLAKYNIEVRQLWKPLHMQTLFKNSRYYSNEKGNSVCEGLFSQGICLPSSSHLSSEQQNRVLSALRDTCV